MTYNRKQMAEYISAYRERRRVEAKEYLGGRCVNCGSQDRLEFDHKDPKSKIANLAHLWTASSDKFWKEVEKCQLLCRKCHLEKSLLCGDIPRGSKSSKAILNEQNVAEARLRYRKGGVTFSQLGKEFGVASGTIRAAIQGRDGKWGHVEEPPVPPRN